MFKMLTFFAFWQALWVLSTATPKAKQTINAPVVRQKERKSEQQQEKVTMTSTFLHSGTTGYDVTQATMHEQFDMSEKRSCDNPCTEFVP